ncbi:MAG: 50S ribosomal protein L22 [Candidatus Colwellbacteria bacterium]|nr:50S ribosomal protein L22 [Candidatus Colwellbacteria bacterium]
MAEIRAKLNRINIAPRKVRAVTGLISRLTVGDAEAQLMFRKERAAGPVLKLLRSAIANAKMKGIDSSRLIVKTVFVDKGPRMKRWLPRARGMATPIHKDFSHITIILEESDKKGRFAVSSLQKTKEVGKKREKAEKKTPAPKKTEEREIKEPVKTERSTPIKKIFRRKSV